MSDEKFTITEVKKKNRRAVVFIIKGRVNSDNAASLEFKINETMREGENNIVLDMSEVDYLTSNGVRVILKGYKKASESGGLLKIENPSENVRNVLSIAALDEMLIKE